VEGNTIIRVLFLKGTHELAPTGLGYYPFGKTKAIVTGGITEERSDELICATKDRLRNK